LANDGGFLYAHIASQGECAMLSYDFSPLFRHSVGFDRMQRLVDTAADHGQMSANSYPPYNIETVGDDQYRISMAIAGFRETDLEIIATDNSLSIKGEIKSQGDTTYLHRGIASRAFERDFNLADYVKVVEARIENGLLNIDLVREVPEAHKPRKIEIKSGPNSIFSDKEKKLIGGDAKVAA
jgi:molecular chaperone IbpA